MARDGNDSAAMTATVGLDDQVDGGQAGADQGDRVVGRQIIECTG